MKLVELVFLLVIFTFFLGQLGRIPIGGGVAVLVTDLLIPVLIFLWLSVSLSVKRRILLPPLWQPLFIFTLIAALSLLNAKRDLGNQDFIVSAAFFVRWLIYTSLYFVAFDLIHSLKGRASFYGNYLIFIVVLVALAGFVQLKILPDFSQFTSIEQGAWDPHQGRILSTFFDPNFVGLFFIFGLVLIFVKFLEVKDRFWKGVLVALGLILFSALILTFSRSSYLAFAITFGVLGFIKWKKLLIGLVVLALIAYLTVPRVGERIRISFEGDASSMSRVTSWQNAWEIIKDHPIFGVGFNTYYFSKVDYGFAERSEDSRFLSGSDSSLLLVFATTGFAGFLVYLFWLSRMFYLSWLKRNSTYSLALFGILIALLIHSQFVNSLFFSHIIGWFWVMAALGLSDKKNLN